MKRLLLTTIVATASLMVLADNTVQKVTQVADAIELTDDVDFHITSAKPFTTTGSVNIKNTDHAVVVLDSLKPSLAIKQLGYIKINGKKATNNTNCQVKIYNYGAIILPYGTSTKPLTLFTEPNFEGSSNNSLIEGHNGSGYMKNIPAAWNNKIRSFKLKRGYMVTFALRQNGRGYSRCFIADKADLEVASLPTIMDGRISSYRIFKWNDVSKRGLGSSDQNMNTVLNSQWAYGWDAGNNIWTDCEYVTQHHHEGWPSIDDVGKNGTSCHALGNNEPDNKGDEREQNVEPSEVLKNWELMMATGKRLGSPAMSGNKTWLREFMDSIDARGWRVDFIAIHDYNLNDVGSKLWNASDYSSIGRNRPVWITEMNYGANWTSWPGSNTSGNAANYKIELDHFGPTIDGYNSADYIERYAFYNWVQDCRSAYLTSDASLKSTNYLTPMGVYYTKVNPGLAYNSRKEYIPKDWRLSKPVLKGTFTAAKGTMKLTWDNPNGDLATTITLERKIGTGNWETLQEYDGFENEAKTSFTYTDNVVQAGAYQYRVHELTYKNKHQYSNVETLSLGGSTGTADFQNGSLSVVPTETSINYFGTPFTEQPVIITGSPSNKNISAGMVDNLLSINKIGDEYRYFQFRLNRWKSDAEKKAANAETVNFLVLKPGRGKLGNLNYEAGYTPEKVGATAVEVRFSQPFAEAPVVFVTPLLATASAPACMWSISNVTAEGFTLQLRLESNLNSALTARDVAFVAIERGSAADGKGTLYTILDDEVSFTAAMMPFNFGSELDTPKVMAQLQTDNNEVGQTLRIGTVTADQTTLRLLVDKSANGKSPTSAKPVTERVALIVTSIDPNYDGIAAPLARQADSTADTYTLTGIRVKKTSRPGIYIKAGHKYVVK